MRIGKEDSILFIDEILCLQLLICSEDSRKLQKLLGLKCKGHYNCMRASYCRPNPKLGLSASWARGEATLAAAWAWAWASSIWLYRGG